MKYLNKRSKFLSYIKEDSGPLSNDIDWGDSLLGRLINASIRKSNIALNAKRIDSLIKLLNDRFEDLRLGSIIENSEDKSISNRINKLKISAILKALNESIISDNSEVNQIISQTGGSIRQIDSFLVENGGDVESTDEYDVDTLLINLNNFLNDLNKKEKQTSIGNNTASGNISAATYNLYLKNLNHLFNLSAIQNGRAEKIGVPAREVEYVSESFDEKGLRNKINSLTNKMNDDATPQPEKEVCRSKIEILQKNLEKLQKQGSNKSDELSTDVIKNDTRKIGDDKNNNAQNKEDVKQLETGDIFDFNKLKAILRPLINYLLQKDKEYIKGFTSLFGSNSKDPSIFERHKQRIAKIYTSLLRQMSVNENMDIILSDSDNFAKKIALVYKQLKGKKLNSPTLTEYVKDIEGFVSSINDILSLSKESVENKNELFKYNSFIKEAVGDSTHLAFQKNLPDDYLNEWLNIDNLKNKLEKDFSELSKNKDNVIVIKGIDPIMDILRLFNRAYKLHTFNYIPSGRSGGKVSQMTLREYDYIGGGSAPSTAAQPGYGPWRNNKIFQKWEDAVDAILSNPDYQTIFNKSTVFQAIGEKGGKPDERVNLNNDNKEGGGRTLLKLINSLMDGDSLYKSGAQSKFIREYFGVEVKDELTGFKNDKKEIYKLTKDIKKRDVLEFKSVNEIKYTPRTIHSLNIIGSNETKTIYMLFQSKDNSNNYFKYSNNFYHLKKCLNSNYEIEKGDLSTLDYNNAEDVYYASVPKNEIFQKGGNVKFNTLSISDYNNDSNTKSNIIDMGKIDKLYTLYESGTSSSIFGLTSSIITSSGDAKDGRVYNEYKSKVR